MRSAAVVVAFVLLEGCSCLVPVSSDGGSDAGTVDARDAGPVALLDGGLVIYGRGCVSPDLNKVIVTLDSRDPQWCAYISMRRWDGGFPTKFPNFTAPENFKVDDARWEVCRDLELPTSLSQDSIPVDDLWGELSFRLVFAGRPRSYDFDGGIQMGPYGFRAVVYAGVTRDCKGN